MTLVALTADTAARRATPADDDDVCAASVALYREDPGARTVTDADVRATLAHFRAHPDAGAVYVLVRAEHVVGYAFLVAFWSNELGGLVGFVDELYVAPHARGAGVGAGFLDALARGALPGFEHVVAVSLEVTPDNVRAQRLYRRLGFTPLKNQVLRRRV